MRSDEMTFDEVDWIAQILYAHFQDRNNHRTGVSLTAGCGTFEDANQYTQTAFRDAVRLVVELVPEKEVI